MTSPFTDPTLQDASEPAWSPIPAAILIMGKRQGTKKENKQLWGRVAMAVLLRYSAPVPRPYVVFVASDVHGPRLTPDAEIVKRMLIEQFHIPADFVITRQRTNCTLLEVRSMKAIKRAYHISHVFALTHLYHAARAQRYLNEVLHGDASVIPVHPEILAEINIPDEIADLYPELQRLIATSQPGRWDNLREHGVEWLLNLAHTLDRRGRFERHLARLLRPGSYRD
ncbi:MAG: ElyC/SanA/YdcF family protein [Anaerolineae bacterium]